ncbi:sugar ABC transporter ATP-binding protein [Nocardioides marmotae]|uniref:sugar ABC transporter ATP-binding protein n=1 Tax=Nocardioides marmotae TaxID=2663857 RepID=UPI0012B52286|nr:sugar ABC transporter ATP-binding protein [Nocardioides marmotae]MBC9732807.1 sugar ABC transporter ATP-binding protein [Nocardioides marmotae]MTB83921.1 ATP-binding cassette domain-containing protein [Nocardioides marmotae]
MTETALVRIRGLSKSFNGARALDEVDLTVQPHEVHGLLGENGSGKSTLIKILAGYHEPDSGVLEVNGVEVPLPLRPGQYRDLGFEFVHQDLGLIPLLTVTENLFMGEISAARRPFWSWRAAQRRAQETFERYGVSIEPQALVQDIRPVDRAMLAIIRAVESLRAVRREEGDSPHMLILDEPTVFLPANEVDVLFDFVRTIVRSGSSVLFVSHDLDEVLEITDQITVLRDGRLAGTAATGELAKRDLVRLIIGHDLEDDDHAQEDEAPGDGRQPALVVRGLTTLGLGDVSFELREGEVLGFAGLVGSGYEDIVYALYGADEHASGTMTLAGGPEIDLRRQNPHAAVRRGFGLVPADRKNNGSVATLTAADNINITVLDRFFKGGRLRRRALAANADDLMKQFDVRPPVADLEYGSFSGGNQQKAMMAKWQQIAPRVLLVHEPTQGVDIGARAQIHQFIRDSAGTTATICTSSDYEQLASLCDRVGVVVRGRLVSFISGSRLTKANIADQCHGRVPAGTASHDG